MKKIISFALAALMMIPMLSLWSCTPEEPADPTPMVDPIDDNYRTFYQVFVGSFSDSNGDGIGDLRGVINRMDYLNDGDINSGNDLGVQGIWLSPIFSSPSYHKYDITDYYKIDWRFGTEEDLKELIRICDERNIKLILDIPINHTSVKHEWFVKFKEARIAGDTSDKYYDYYSCAKTDERQNGSTYQKIAGVDCWYECNFSGDMPELNMDNEDVREDVLDIAKYYLDLGIDGFRFDAIKYVYYNDTPSSVEFWDWYMEELRKIDPEIYCVGECWSGETEVLEYIGSLNCFNFSMSQAEGFAAVAARGTNVNSFTNYIESYQKRVEEKGEHAMPIQFLSNHDMDRIAGAFVTENNMKMAANLYLLSPGSPFIYYGEEIGMRGSRGSAMTDANRRLAMLWGDDDLIRDPIGSTYPDDKQIKTTVADQLDDENSIYNHYRKLIAIRHAHPEIARGKYTAFTTDVKTVGGFLVEYEGKSIVVIHNVSVNEEEIDLAQIAKLSGCSVEKVLDSIGIGQARLQGTKLTLGGQTSAVLG